MEWKRMEWNRKNVPLYCLDILRWNGINLPLHYLDKGRNGMSYNIFTPTLPLLEFLIFETTKPNSHKKTIFCIMPLPLLVHRSPAIANETIIQVFFTLLHSFIFFIRFSFEF